MTGVGTTGEVEGLTLGVRTTTFFFITEKKWKEYMQITV